MIRVRVGLGVRGDATVVRMLLLRVWIRGGLRLLCYCIVLVTMAYSVRRVRGMRLPGRLVVACIEWKLGGQ